MQKVLDSTEATAMHANAFNQARGACVNSPFGGRVASNTGEEAAAMASSGGA